VLYLVATPIGNLEDLSPRALAVLREAEIIACEDTRRTWALLSHFGIPRPRDFWSYRQGMEEAVGRRIMEALGQERSVAMCSDGGYPGISDPGYRIVRSVCEAGLELSVIPGPSAVPVALLSSGLPTSSYTFKGYPPRKPGPLRRFFEEERDAPHTLVVFESPHRVGATLAAARGVLGERQAAVCMELTKKFERVARGYLGELSERFAGERVRGEVTIVVAGNNPKFSLQPENPDPG
jgi:16S rRNA (cytidine1402-2'-O)-methyltransferase